MKLYNGVVMPSIGYGTWQAPDNDITVQGIKAAVKAGYRHIDTAAIYKNEISVGKGVAECGVAREELFVTSKVWNTNRGYKNTLSAFEKTMNDLKLPYLDLYLIHWPAAAHQFSDWNDINRETWRAMTELYKAGKIKAIGVSNFKPHHLKALMDAEVKPMVNQIEFHPGMLQKETVKYCNDNGIIVEAWSPLGRGRLLSDPTLTEIAEKCGKSVAQICIRWCLQHGTVPLPKSVTEARIKENIDVFDFAIEQKDMERIDALDNYGGSGLDPDTVDF